MTSAVMVASRVPLVDLSGAFEPGPRRDEGREAFFSPNVWPDPERVPDFRAALNACYEVLEGLAAKLMGLMALALDLDEHWFDEKIAEHITGLAVLHYPALEEPPLSGQYRRGPHSDWGSLTILYHDGKPGLQILSPEGQWEDVPAVAGSFVVNLGDLMAAWTTLSPSLRCPRSR